MTALLIAMGALAVVVLMAPAWAEWKRHLSRRRARQRFTDPGWTEWIPNRYVTPELQRRLRNRPGTTTEQRVEAVKRATSRVKTGAPIDFEKEMRG